MQTFKNSANTEKPNKPVIVVFTYDSAKVT